MRIDRLVCNDRYIGKDVSDALAFPATLKRLMAKSRRTESGCLEWMGWRNQEGYGEISFRGENTPTHRVMYTVTKGPIPEGMIVRHSCDNPPCMEGGHLILGTEADNTADSLERGRHYRAAKTICKRGHDLATHARVTAEGFRACKICDRIRQRIRAGWSEEDALSEPVGLVGYRPAHIRLVEPPKVRAKESSHCTAGHELAGDNLYISPRGYHECQICRNVARERFRAKKRATAKSTGDE